MVAKASRELETPAAGAREAPEGVTRKEGAPLEVRRRAGRILGGLQARSPERRREVRAVQVLECQGTAEARQLLRRLAEGAPEARLTQEARASLRRLAR